MPLYLPANNDERILIDEASATETYIGYGHVGDATSDATWKIKKITLVGSDETLIQYADGLASYENIWDDRASYTYS